MKVYLLSALLFTHISSMAQSPMPRLQREGNAVQLAVNDQPFLVLGGELGSAGGENNIRISPSLL